MDERKVIFLDRDGVINRRAPEHKYIYEWEAFEFLPGAVEAIRRCSEAGYLVIVVSNQRGIARGIFTRAQADALHEKMCRELKKEGADVYRVYVCPHENGACECRKPKPGLFLLAERELLEERRAKIDKGRSWMIGDEEKDILAGRAYGVHTVWVGAKERGPADLTADSLLDAVNKIFNIQKISKK